MCDAVGEDGATEGVSDVLLAYDIAEAGGSPFSVEDGAHGCWRREGEWIRYS